MDIKRFSIAIVLVVSTSIQGVGVAGAFSDVLPGDWYSVYVSDLLSAGIIDENKSTFEPSLHVSRDVAAKVLLKASGYSDANLIIPDLASFKDVPKSLWGYPYIETAKSKGIVSGYEGGNYGPSYDVSRAEFAAMIVRTFKLEKADSEVSKFTDIDASDWFASDIEIVKSHSIVSGYSEGLFRPYDSINRAEMSKMLVTAMNISPSLVVEDDVDLVDEPVEDDEPLVDDDEPVVVDELVDDEPVVEPAQPSPPTSHYYEDGEIFDPWLVQFNGYGTVGIESEGTESWVHLSPQAANAPDITHAALITGPSYTGAIQFQANIFTVEQLRTASAPNAWEVAWIVWNYTDNDHFYYFIPKPNGWELGKRDPSYPGGQRFLATGSNILFPISTWYDVKIEQDSSNNITVWVDESEITKFKDEETPYSSGNIGLYTEDAHIHVGEVSVEQ